MIAVALSTLGTSGASGFAEENKEKEVAFRHKVVLYEAPSNLSLASDSNLNTVSELGSHSAPIHSIVWEDTENLEGKSATELVTACQKEICEWDLVS